MSVTRAKGVTYWICTALVAFFMISGGFANLFLPEAIAGIVKLGYPRFFASILCVWKVLGGIAILMPGFARLKEWAYAGITFELTGAAITNAIVGEIGGPLGYGAHIAAPLIIALLALLSWALRPGNRTLGAARPEPPGTLDVARELRQLAEGGPQAFEEGAVERGSGW